jgi:hypothetical protein
VVIAKSKGQSNATEDWARRWTMSVEENADRQLV